MTSTDRSLTLVVTGATGFLGRAIVEELESRNSKWNVVGTGLGRAFPPTISLDLTNGPHMTKIITDLKPDIIIHSAAERRPDVAAKDPGALYEVNVAASAELAKLTSKLSVPMIYVSTDYVFDGTNSPYEPEDDTNPTNVYGISKRDGEVEVLKYNEKALVLRVPVMQLSNELLISNKTRYGEVETSSESSINVLLEIVLNVSRQTEVKMDNWQIRYPTNTKDVGRVITDLSVMLLDKPDTVPPILHFSASQKFTKYDICKIFGELLGVPIFHLKPVNTNDHAQHGVMRPYDCYLSSKKLESLGVSIKTADFVQWWRKELLPARR
ncbi:hypothetical protein V1512DRAFT_200834 [Lipomyces arxii]|uniref:uncharacterized protein n=1 Tax=Lipomyces arxii TaxID=56418 RepID=UPI0034CEB78C